MFPYYSQTGKVWLTDFEKIFVKNDNPVVPPGILAITVHNNEIICPTANRTVNGVLCKCNAQYNVAKSVPPYVNVKKIRSLENICFK